MSFFRRGWWTASHGDGPDVTLEMRELARQLLIAGESLSVIAHELGVFTRDLDLALWRFPVWVDRVSTDDSDW